MSLNKLPADKKSMMLINLKTAVWLGLKLSFIFILFASLFGKASSSNKMPVLSKIPTPPSFIHEPNPGKIHFVIEQSGPSFKADNSSSSLNLRERTFRCRASGYPTVSYRWLKNGKDFNLDNVLLVGRLSRIPGEGSFIISRLRDDDEGVYQCIAENGNGTAVDKEIDFRKTFINLMPAGVTTYDVEYGEPFEKECVPPRSVPEARSYWILTSGESAERRLFQTINYTNVALNEKGKIFFQYVRDEDNIPGFYYTCTAENSELKDYKFGFQFNFNVTKNPMLRTSLEPYILPRYQYYSPPQVTVLQGESLELFCIVAGYPDYIPNWSKVKGQLDLTRVSWNTNFKKSMKIDNITANDGGDYSCTFEDRQLDRTFSVSVEAAPYWIGSPPKNMNSTEGSDVDFNCNAVGQPTPVFTFYKNGVEIRNPSKRYVIDGSHLQIKNIRKGDRGAGDNAVYQCKASNRHGSLWTNFYLNILAFEPIILRAPETIETVEGQNVTFSCKVFGSPKPSVTWKSDPQLLGTENVDFNTTTVDNDGVSRLTLFNVKRQHQGVYACVFRNLYNSTEAQGQLIVRNATTVVDWKPRAAFSVGDSARLQCTATHDASLPVAYRWSFNGRPLPLDDQRRLVDADGRALTIATVTGDDTGEYACFAETSLDVDKRVAAVVVRDVPPSPVDLFVECNDKHASVSFYYAERPAIARLALEQQDPDAADVAADHWLIQYSMEPDAWETYATEVTSLKNGRGELTVDTFPYGAFAFRALARNKIGSSVPAYPKRVINGVDDRCKTAPERPFRNPDQVQVHANTENSLIVTWQPLHRREWNARHFSYLVEYRPKNLTSAPFDNVTIDDPYRDTVVINGVPSYSDYTVRVWSQNELGKATVAPRPIDGKSGETAPSDSPSNFRYISIEGPSVATFSWDKVDPSSVNGEFKGYKVQYWTSSSNRLAKRQVEDTIKEAYFDREADSGTIYNLRPNGVNYAFIVVYNNYGDGPRSPTIQIRMPEGVPTAVQDFDVFPISNDEIGAVWSPPVETNGDFLGYEAKICQLQHDEMVEETCRINHIGADAFAETRFKGLNTSMPYRVEIRGKTKAGLGDPISFDTATTRFYETGPPSEPSIGKIEAGFDHLNVTWKPGKEDSDANVPPGNSYYLQYREKGDAPWVTANDSSFANGLTVTLSNLKPNTEYEVRAISSYHGFDTTSKPQPAATHAGPSRSSISGWLIAIIAAIMILAIILILVCLVVRSRGAKYPVSEKEKEQGREPMLKDDRGFGEYSRPDADEDKKSVAAESVKTASETDSMAEYGDGETGRFTEDGSFIGQYAAPRQPPGQDRGGKKPNSSTFV